MIDPHDIRANDRAWELYDRLLGDEDWERRTRERLADRASIPLIYVDSLGMADVEILLGGA